MVSFMVKMNVVMSFDIQSGILKINFTEPILIPGYTKGGSITLPLTSCLTGLELAV
jgi:hypothetical protein